MSVLVTGGSGFIGSEVVQLLLERGEDEVHVAYRSQRLQRLHGWTDRVILHALDLADLTQVSALVQTVRPRSIYHLGAMLSGPSEADPQAAIHVNAYGTHALLEAARLNNVEQFLFSSSMGVYVGAEWPDGPVRDDTLQRPDLIYGVTKVFGELLGRYYRRIYGLDFRGLRFPAIVGPGVTTKSLAQYTSWMIEYPARGEPFTVWVSPETSVPVVYFKEAGRAMVQLADAPRDAIKTVNYNIDGVKPSPNAAQLADAVRATIPGAVIDFAIDPAIDGLFAKVRTIDDTCAHTEWGWAPTHDYLAMVDDFVGEMRNNRERYR